MHFESAPLTKVTGKNSFLSFKSCGPSW